MKTRILLVDDDHQITRSLQLGLKHAFEVRVANSVETAQDILAQESFDVVVTDVVFHGSPLTGLSLIEWMEAKQSQTPIIVMSGEATAQQALSIRNRIEDAFLLKPVSLDDLRCAIEKAKERVESKLRKPARAVREVLTEDPRVLAELERVRRAIEAESVNVCILIRGEPGSGKEEIAKFAASVRGGNYVALNMGAIPQSLAESELFGHTKGAFTGAATNKIGKFQAANGGVLFLDEIADCPLDVQVKLLRAIQEREVVRVGANAPEKVDVKLVFATNLNLETLIAQGRFREDLYGRIRGVEVRLPPLRERRGDISILVGKFLQMGSPGNKSVSITSQALQALTVYHWPGNVRELKTAVEVALLNSNFTEVDLQHLPPGVLGAVPEPGMMTISEGQAIEDLNLDKAIENIEVATIKKALVRANGSYKKAIDFLGITESKFFRRLREYNISEGR
jgi:DNA-binding NtrC family response regulator